MLRKPNTGLAHSQTFTVAREHCIDFGGTDLPAVLSTPILIRHLEMTARETVADCLEEGEVTLGTSVELNHLAPSPLGQEITCTARLVRVDGVNLSFAIEAHDRVEIIAKGFHTRAVIQKERFARRVGKKLGR